MTGQGQAGMRVCISLTLFMISMETEPSFGKQQALKEPCQCPVPESVYRGEGRVLSLYYKQDPYKSL